MPTFAKYVRAVDGRLVSRLDVAPGTHLGARLTEEGPVWDTERVIPLTAEYCAKFARELRKTFAARDLIECTEAEYQAWLQIEEEREAAREAEVAAAQAAAELKETA